MKGYKYALLRKAAAAYNAKEGNTTAAAELFGVPASTFRAYLRHIKKHQPALLKAFTPTQPTKPAELFVAVRAEAWKAFQECGHSYTVAARQLAIPETTLKDRIKAYCRLHGIDQGKLRAETTVQDDAIAHRHNESASAERAKLKDAMRIITGLEDRIKELEWASKAELTPAEWTLPARKPKAREHMPYLLTSDAQLGEVIKADETEAGYGYDSSIYRSRFRRLIDTVIYLSFEHTGSLWTYPGIIYARGGDTISGGIHEELRETDDLTPVEACEVAFEEESAGIRKLAEAFGKVEVKTPGAAGNHDRNTFKPATKNASGHSYDRLIAFMLGREFKNDPRVTFQTSKSFDVRFNIYDMQILLTHGDRMGSRGGQGFVGPAATIMRGVQKVFMEQAALGFKIDRVDHGHFHYFMYLDWVLSNGCMPGYSEYAKSYRMRPTPPTQTLVYHHPKRGCVDIKPINLVEPVA